MSTATSAGTRCASTVVSLLWRALGSLTFGRVLIGAALIWVAAMVGAVGGNSHQLNSTAGTNEFAAAAEQHDIVLVSAQVDGNDSSAEIDDSGVSSLAGQPGVGGRARVSGASSASGQLSANPSGHRPRSLSELRAARQQQVADPGTEESTSWPLVDGHGHGRDSAATSAVANLRTAADPGPVSALTHAVAGSIRSAVDPVLTFVSGLADRLAGTSTGASGQSTTATATASADRAAGGQAAREPATGAGAQGLEAIGNAREAVSDTRVAAHDSIKDSRPAATDARTAARDTVADTRAGARDAAARSGTRGGAPQKATPDPVDLSQVQPAAPSTNTSTNTSTQRPAAARQQSDGTPIRQVSTERLDGIFTGAVDLASGIVTAVAGDRAGARTRQALTGVADELKDALAAGDALNGGGAHNSGAPPSDRQTNFVSPSRGQHGTGGASPDAVQADPWSGQAGQHDALAGARGQGDPAPSQVSWTGARGPPAAATNLTDALRTALHEVSAHPASQTSTTEPTARLPRLDDKTLKSISDSAADFTQNLIKQVGGTVTSALSNSRPGTTGPTGQHNAQGDRPGSIHRPVINFLQDLMERLGKAEPESPADEIRRGNQSGMHAQQPPSSSLDNALSQFVNTASGVVSDIAGGTAGEQTRRALTDLTDQLTNSLDKMNKPGNGSATSSPGSGVPGKPAADLASSIRESANNFVADLLQRLGISQPSAATGNQAAQQVAPRNLTEALSHFVDVATGIVSDIAGKKAGKQTHEALSDLTDQLTAGPSNPRPTTGSGTSSSGSGAQQQTNLGSAIGQLVDNFVGNLLQLLGVSSPATSTGQQSANQSTTDQGGTSTQQANPQNLDDALSNFTDLASGIVSNVAGTKAGKQTQQALTDLTDQLTDGLSNPNPGHNSSAQNIQASHNTVNTVASTIRESAGNFVGDLLDQLGLTQPGRSGPPTTGRALSAGHQQRPNDRPRAGAIADATDSFVRDLLQRLGVGQQGGSDRASGVGQLTDADASQLSQRQPAQGQPAQRQTAQRQTGQTGQTADNDQDQDDLGQPWRNRPGSQNTSGATQRRPATLDDFQQVLSGVVDAVSGLVTVAAGQQAGAQARQMLTAAAEDVLEALQAANTGPNGGASGGGSGGNGGQATGGQDSGSSLGADNQFAGTECQSDDECALVGGTLKPRQPSSLGSRAPPPLLADNTTDPDQQYKLAAWWQDTSSATGVNQALNDRLAVIKGQQGVDDAKAQLAKGAITQAAYNEKVSAQQALQTKADTSTAAVSPYDGQLIDETIKGQQSLTAAKTKLDADQQQLAAGKLDQATYDQRAAAYAAQQDQVYAQTQQLRDAAGGSALQEPDGGRDGAGASCGTSGAFGECATTTTDATTGQSSEDRSLCLVGVSGCSSSSRAGDRTASASCDVSGCKTNSTAGKTTASATCGTGDCNTQTVADSRGADTSCQARGGCTTSGRTPTEPDAADLAAGKTEGAAEATGSCTKNCALTSFANRADAGSDCNTSNGTCDTSSTGSRATETAPTGATPADTSASDSATAPAAAQRAKENGEASSKAHCQADTVGCDVTTTVRAGVTDTGQRGWLAGLLYGDDARTPSTTSVAPAAEAAAHCASGATGCTGNAETSTGGRTEHTDTTAATPAVAADPTTGQPAVAAVPAKTNTDSRAQSGTATCQVDGGSCTSSSGLGDDQGTLANSGIECDRATGCSGKASTSTHAEITAGIDGKTATRTTDAHHDCTVGGATGDCANDSSSTVGNTGPAPDTSTAGYPAQTAVYNTAAAPGATETAAPGNTVTPATDAATPAPTTSATPKADPVAELAKGLTASSRTTATLSCGSADCKASESGASSGGASGDVTGGRDSNGATKCSVHGVGGTCGSVSDTEVAHRDAQPAAGGKPATPAGPVSVSHADAQVRCTDSTECGGNSYAETSALDTAVSKDRRGSSTGADCTVKGGGCLGQASSAASTVAEYVQLGPKTGQPIKGQPTSGPTSTSRSAASIDCTSTTCSGSAHTTSAAWDGAVAGGKPRTSEGSVSCTTGSGSCQVQTLSTATTGPGAATTYAPDGQAANAARMPDGPSAASVVGGKMTCDGSGGECTGMISASVTATDPTVSPDPRGNQSVGSCSGVTGGRCQAVVNGAASSGPDANSIAPLVQDTSSDNATVTSDDTGNTTAGGSAANGGGTGTTTGKPTTASPSDGQSPAGQGGQAPTQPATAPGSSANSGGPTVPGASSWSSASATLTCDGSGPCQGTPHGVATGIDGADHTGGGTGSRGPPEATGETTSTCDTTGSACQAVSSSTAASGQVVADVFTEQNKAAAQQATDQATQTQQAADKAKQTAALPGATAAQKQAATDAAKTADQAKQAAASATEAANKPLPADAVPATWSESSAMAQCTGPGCTASTTGATSGTPGDSHTDATCSTTATGGCAVTSDATVTTVPNAGQSQDDKSTTVPGAAGNAQTTSQLVCPEAGCTGSLHGTAKSVGGPNGQQTTSTATGDTTCDASTACQAQITAGSTRTIATDDDPAKGSASTSAFVTAACDNGTKTGCATHASSNTDVIGAAKVTAEAGATCRADGQCQAGTGGMAGKDFAQVNASCAGTGCKTHIEGAGEATSQGGTNTAKANSDCTAGPNGQCASTGQVAASKEYALAGSGCAGTEGSTCSFSYRSESHARAAGAKADAVGSQTGEFGGGQAITSATAQSSGNSAQASASCQGADGAQCSYHYEATRSASMRDKSGSHAEAYAHGVGGGSKGAGGVAVSASAYAKGNQAYASASCSGQADCSGTHYSAFAADSASAEVAPTPTEWGGRLDATKTAQCSGSGSGGCGVTATANPYDPDGGTATCSGNCANFSQSMNAPTFTKTTPPTGPPPGTTGQATGKDGKPLDLGDLGPTQSGSTAGLDKDGNPTLSYKASGADPKTCDAKCVQGLPTGADGRKVFSSGDNGPQASYDPKAPASSDTRFGASDQVANGDNRRHQVYGQTSAAIARDDKGRTQATVGGNGSVTDGRSGKRLTITADSPSSVNKVKIVDANIPFQTDQKVNGSITYTGPKVELPKGAKPIKDGAPGFESLTTHGTWAKITAGEGGSTDGAGFQFNGSGEYKSAWGDDFTLRSGKADIVVRDTMGWGGHMRFESDGNVAGNATITSAEGAGVECGYCTGEGDRAGFGMHEMPTGPGLGGRNSCFSTTSSCTGTGPNQKATGQPDSMFGEVDWHGTGKGKFEWVQQLRNDDGSGGWAVGFADGTGYVWAQDGSKYRDWVRDSGNGAGVFLGYAEDDGYGRGQSCAGGTEGGSGTTGGCSGSAKPEDRLRWINPDASVTMALGMSDTEEKARPKGFVGPLPMETVGRQDLMSRALAVARYGTGNTHDAWMAQTGNKLIAPITKAMDDADRDGVVTLDEQNQIAGMIDKLDDKTKQRIGKTRQAVDDVRMVNATQPRSADEIERQLVDDPKLVAQYNKDYTYDPKHPPTEAQRTQAKNNLVNEQNVARTNADKLAGFADDRQSLADRQTKYDQAVAAYNRGEGGNKADLDKEKASLIAASKDLQQKQQPYMDALDASQGRLRNLDLAAADLANAPGYADDIQVAKENADRVDGFMKHMVDPDTAEQAKAAQKIAGFTDSVYAGYDASIEAPRQPGNRLGDMWLPSTGNDDFARTFDASINYPKFLADNSKLSDYYKHLANSKDVADRNQLTEFAAEGTPQDFANRQFTAEHKTISLGADDDASRRIRDLTGKGKDDSIDVDVVRMLYSPPKDGDKPQKDEWINLFRITDKDGRVRYVDPKGNDFGNFNDLREHNEMFPKDGTLTAADGQDGLYIAPGIDPKTGSPTDPAGGKAVGMSSDSAKYENGWKVAGKWIAAGAMFVGGVVFTVGGGVAAIATAGLATPAAIGGIAMIGGASYLISDAVDNIQERSAHGQSNSWSNPAARADYFTIAGSALSFIGFGASLASAARGATAAGGVMAAGGAELSVANAGRLSFASAAAASRTPVAVWANRASMAAFAEPMAESAYSLGRYYATNPNPGQDGYMSPATRTDAWVGLGTGALMMGAPIALARAPFMTGYRGGPATGPASLPRGPNEPGLTVGDRISQATGANEGVRPPPRQLASDLGASPKDVRGAIRESSIQPLVNRVSEMTANNNGVRPSVREVAAETGVSKTEARSALHAMDSQTYHGTNLPRPDNGGPTTGRTLPERIAADAEANSGQQRSVPELARRYGVGEQTVRNALRANDHQDLVTQVNQMTDDDGVRPTARDVARETGASRRDARSAIRTADRQAALRQVVEQAGQPGNPQTATQQSSAQQSSAQQTGAQQTGAQQSSAQQTGSQQSGSQRAGAQQPAQQGGQQPAQPGAQQPGAPSTPAIRQSGQQNNPGAGDPAQSANHQQGNPPPTQSGNPRPGGSQPVVQQTGQQQGGGPGQPASGQITAASTPSTTTRPANTTATPVVQRSTSGSTGSADQGTSGGAVLQPGKGGGPGRPGVPDPQPAPPTNQTNTRVGGSGGSGGDGTPLSDGPPGGPAGGRQVSGQGSTDSKPAVPENPLDYSPSNGPPGQRDTATKPNPSEETQPGTGDGELSVNRADEQSGGPQSTELPLGPTKACGCEAPTRARSADPSNPGQIPTPIRRDQLTDQVQENLESGFNGRTELTGEAQLNQRMADPAVPEGTGVFVWTTGEGGAAHVIYGVKTRTGMQFYDGSDVLHSAPENTRAVTVRDSGRGPGPKLADEISPYVGAKSREPGKDGSEEAAGKATPGKDVTGEDTAGAARGGDDTSKTGSGTQPSIGEFGAPAKTPRPSAGYHRPDAERPLSEIAGGKDLGATTSVGQLRPKGAEAPDAAALKADLKNARTALKAATTEAATTEAAKQALQAKVDDLRHQLKVESATRSVRDEISAIKQLWSTLTRDERLALVDRALTDPTMSRVEHYALLAELIRLTPSASGKFRLLHDVQLAGAILLDEGGLAGKARFAILKGRTRGLVLEMKTGEGKEITGLLPAARRALQLRAEFGPAADGYGVHVVTTDSILAGKTATTYRSVLSKIGLTVGELKPGEQVGRRGEYDADITVGSASEFLFDYLADRQLAPGEQPVQRGRTFALIDEADMVLVDWGRTPYRLAQSLGVARHWELLSARELALKLEKGEYSKGRNGYSVSAKQAKRIEQRLELPGSLTEQQRKEIANALYARTQNLDVDFTIQNGDVVEILDNLNGRGQAGQRWEDGVHEAVEVELGLTLRPKQIKIAETTTVGYFGSYDRIAGMTGTAKAVGRLLGKLYDLDVVEMATHAPSKLQQLPRRMYTSEDAWLNAIADEITQAHADGNTAPWLINFRTPKASERFFELLAGRNVNVDVLNARGERVHFEKARVDAAGRPGAVTVVTNIAARGTDIVLGGVGRQSATSAARQLVLGQGGLRVRAGQLFESSRGTEQLFGRAARQGDPGQAGEMLYIGDHILTTYGNKPLLWALRKSNGTSDEAMTGRLMTRVVDRAVNRAQRAADRDLVRVVNGKSQPKTLIERVLPARRTADQSELDAPRTREVTETETRQQLEQAAERVEQLVPVVRDARVDFAQTTGSDRDVDKACSGLCSAEAGMAGALGDYHQAVADFLAEEAPHLADHPKASPSPEQTQAADAVTDALTNLSDADAAAHLGISPHTVGLIRQRLAAADYTGALLLLRNLVNGVHQVARPGTGNWAEAPWAEAVGGQASAAVQRMLLLTGSVHAGFEHREVAVELSRLHRLLSTVPAGEAQTALVRAHQLAEQAKAAKAGTDGKGQSGGDPATASGPAKNGSQVPVPGTSEADQAGTTGDTSGDQGADPATTSGDGDQSSDPSGTTSGDTDQDSNATTTATSSTGGGSAGRRWPAATGFTAVVLGGAGGGLALAGLPLSPTVLISGALVTAVVTVAIRPIWTPRQARAPPSVAVLLAAVANLPTAAVVGSALAIVFGAPLGIVTGAGVLTGLTIRSLYRQTTRTSGARRIGGAAAVLIAATFGLSGLLGIVGESPAHASPVVAEQTVQLAVGAEVRVVGTQGGPVMGYEVEFTAADSDRAITVARGLGYEDRQFGEFNQLNGNRFTGPNERIGGESVRAPASWTGTWIAQPGDSYWRIFVDRFHDLAGYRGAISGLPNPDHLDKRAPVQVQTPPTQSGPPGTSQSPGSSQSSPSGTPSGSPTTGQSQTGSPTTSATASGTQNPLPGQGQRGSGRSWISLLILGGSVLALVSGFFGWRYGQAVGGFFTGARTVFGNWSTPPPGRWRTGLRIGAAVGGGIAAGLVLVGGPVATVGAGLAAAVAVAAVARSLWDRPWTGVVVLGSAIAVVTGVVAGSIPLVAAGVVGPVAMLTRGGIGAFRASEFGPRLEAGAAARTKAVVAILTGVVGVVSLTRFTSIFTNTLDLLPFSNGWLVFTMGGLFAAAHLGLVVRFNLTQLGNLLTTPKNLSKGWKSFWAWLGVIGPAAMVSGLLVMLYSLATTPAGANTLVTMLATATASSMALGVTYQTWHLGREGLR
ncbi:MAG TPA: DUF4781 domain-containing protein, partial [Pseudonocardia sp.]|nr:DUF4781 domain-containing protein [Pseudonocardia sp.]